MHSWGRANKITFDDEKEFSSIISNHDPEGPDYKIMGMWFDTCLSMKRVIQELVDQVRWKLTTLLRAKKFFSVQDLIDQYKARLLGYVEYCTSAIYHADAGLLDLIQR